MHYAHTFFLLVIGSSKTLQAAISEQDKLRKEMLILRRSLQSLQNKRTQHNQQIYQYHTEKHSTVEKQLKVFLSYLDILWKCIFTVFNR